MPANKCSIAIIEDDANFHRAVERLRRESGSEEHTFASAAVFITPQDEESIREQASGLPESVYLRKPFLGAVNSGLNRSGSEAQNLGI
jgi:hypothetical protein